MQWADYFRNVVTRYLVAVMGWPENIPFVNLSIASNSLAQLEQLLQGWEDGSIYWEIISEDKLPGMREALTTSGHRVEHTRRIHSDKGKKHKRSANPEAMDLFLLTTKVKTNSLVVGDLPHLSF